MQNILLLFFLSFIYLNGFAQSIKYGKEPSSKENNSSVTEKKIGKIETENWILSKLTTYRKELLNTTGITYVNDNYEFQFSKEYIIIKYTRHDLTIVGNTDKIINVERVPIYDIKSLNCSQGDLMLITNKKTILKNANNKQTVDNYTIIGFNCESETDLDTRLSNAFKYLKNFYSKPKSSEVF